ncbi:MAG: extracellular solute-binding protein [Pseudomonadota bacterium]|nr:extracellular solute-binding protein [Pseudomonadota bacterium]
MRWLSLIALSLCVQAFAFAADTPRTPGSAAELAVYQGADRQERLIAAAKKEGELSVYHVYPNLPLVMDAFTKKYGIKVKAWRSGSEGVLQRLTTEARGGRFEADVVQNNAPENEAAHRERLLQEVRSPFAKDLLPAATPAHHEWTGITIDVFVAAYNTDRVKKEDLPKTYQDLLDPKWKGKLGIEVDDQHWFNGLATAMGEKQTYKLFSDIVATNGISVRKGHSLLANLVASGEVPLGLTIYSWIPEQLKQKGAPIEALPLSPVVAQFSTIALPRRSPHPYAALLFYDFMLSEGQQLLANLKYVPTSTRFETPMTKVPLKFIDPGQAIDLQDKWTKTYEEFVTKAAK